MGCRDIPFALCRRAGESGAVGLLSSGCGSLEPSPNTVRLVLEKAICGESLASLLALWGELHASLFLLVINLSQRMRFAEESKLEVSRLVSLITSWKCFSSRGWGCLRMSAEFQTLLCLSLLGKMRFYGLCLVKGLVPSRISLGVVWRPIQTTHCGAVDLYINTNSGALSQRIWNQNLGEIGSRNLYDCPVW